MKKVYLVTLCTCLVVIALVSASVYFLRDEEKEITVGFVYAGGNPDKIRGSGKSHCTQ